MMKGTLLAFAVAAFALLSAIIAAPQSGGMNGGGSGGLDPSNLSDQQKQDLSNQLKQQLQQIGFDVSQLPMDSNGNIDLSKLPRDSNGNIELSKVVNGSGGSNVNGGGGSNVNGGGGLNVNGGGGLNVNGGGGSNGPGNGGAKDLSSDRKAQISMELEQYLKSIGFDVSLLPRDSNGNIALNQLPHDSNGSLEINEIVNGEGGTNGGSANGDVNIHGNANGGVNIHGNGGGACNNGRKIPATGNVNGYRCLDDKDYYKGNIPLSVFDLEKIVCSGGIQYAEGGIINGTQIGLNMISDGAARLLKGIAGKKGNPGSANLFDRAANQADITLNTFIDRAGDTTRTFFCGITRTLHKLLKGIKDGKPLGGLSAAAIFFLKGVLKFFGYNIGGGVLQTVGKAVTGVEHILG